MEQRPLRLGDILDDYCPRERRVTNHAIVAMIEDEVRQTRCTTCDAEHVYKGGKAPRRRAAKESPAALYKEVLAGMEGDTTPALAAPAEPPEPVEDIPPPVVAALAPVEAAGKAHGAPPAVEEASAPHAEHDAPPALEEGPVHRPLIRATLPRVEGQKEARPIPDFTMRQPIGRGRFRGAGGGDGRSRFRGGGQANGNGHRDGGQRAGGRRRRGR
jgi:uncharacterized membrane protein YgcG